MLTLGTLLRSSSQEVLRNIKKYKLDAYTTKTGEDEFGAYIRFLAQIIGSKGSRNSTITAYDAQISIASPVMVYCSCDYFKYNLEIALTARGSALQLHADGLFPKQKNKTFKPGLCPHLALLAKIALKSDQAQESAKINKVARVRISKKLK